VHRRYHLTVSALALTAFATPAFAQQATAGEGIAQPNATPTQSQTAPTVPPGSTSGAPAATTGAATAGTDTVDTTGAGAATGGDVVVTGVRASLQSAANIKRNADSIVDSIVAEDIGKLPDNNATEALQRITGVQVSRDVGEGGSIAIRGLPQVETTLNGRETFTAGGGRTFNLQDLPAELLARIDVYKSPTPDLIEGGLGGIVDVRTHRPFDFTGATVSGTVRNTYSDLIGKSAPQASLLASDRWDTGIGEIGILGAVSYQERSYRQDLDSTGAPLVRTNLVAGQAIFAPNGNYQPLIVGQRQRIGANAALQWRPAPNLEFTLEGQYQRFKTTQQQYAVNIPTNGSALLAGSLTLFPGTSDVQQATYLNQIITASGTERDTQDENKQIALNGRWSTGGFTLTGDVAYTHSTNDLYYTELDLITHAPTFTQYLNTSVPSSSVSGIDLSNLANYTVGPLTRSENHYKGHEFAARLDGEYKFDSGFLSAIDVGGRYADRTIAFTPIRFYSQSPVTNPLAVSNLFQSNGFYNFYTGGDASGDFQRNYPHAIASFVGNNFSSVAQQLGFTTAPTVSQVSVFAADEKTYAGYAIAKFAFTAGVPIDGNIGVRVVRTQEKLNSFQPVLTAVADPITGAVTYRQTGIAAVSADTNYTNWLPSANVRVHLTDKLQLRLAASKTLTRPDFNQLSPAITTVPAQLAATGGNPDLQPIKSSSADVSLEWYFSHASSIYAAAFYKRVDGFIFTSTRSGVTIDGTSGYTLSQPLNSGKGTVKGIETGYQQFFDFLPGVLSGLGLQANFTFVDSNAPTSIAGLTAALPQLSKYSYNVAGIYEKGGVSLRVAYNWRSSFLSSIYAGAYTAPGTTQSVTFTSPVMTKGYGWLDASLNYDVTPQFTLSVDAQNLLRTQIQTYYGYETRPGSFTIDDRQFMVGARIKF